MASVVDLYSSLQG